MLALSPDAEIGEVVRRLPLVRSYPETNGIIGDATDVLNNQANAVVGVWSNQITETITTLPTTFFNSTARLTVDGNFCTVPCVETWIVGSQHTIQAAGSYVAAGGTSEYLFSGWSDSGTLWHNVTAAAGTVTASYSPQYYLTTAASPSNGGSISPASGWYAAGAVVPEHTVVTPRTLWAGVPAKMRRELSGKDRALILEYAQNYLDYTEIYLGEIDPVTAR